MDYTITASNKGTVDATNITVVDTPPDSGLLSIGAWTCAASGGAACPNAGGTGAVDETIASLPLGSSLTYSFSATVLAGGGTHIVNTATLTSQLANYGCSGSAVTPCTATATLIGRYKPPVAVDDAANAYGDPVAVAVLDNDSDPDDAALSVDSTTNPSQGSATVDGDVVIYTPDPTAIGTDTFTYTISNAHGLTATATVTITDHLTLTYDPNEGTGTVPDAVTTAVADQSVADGDSLARHGYRFTGWNTSADGTGDGYAPGDTIDLSTIGNVTLYAQWAQVESNQTASPSTDSNSDLASTGADGIPFLLAAVLLALTGGIVLIGIARRSRN